MTIKNMLMLTGLLAGAAYLRDKGRRDRLVGKARGLIDNAKSRASEVAGRVEEKADDLLASKDNGVSSGAGATTRASSYDTFGTSRNYR